MGLIAKDMTTGRMCSGYGQMFRKEHGHPVLCTGCWDGMTPEERAAMGVPKASNREL